jgi:hypothetical protein
MRKASLCCREFDALVPEALEGRLAPARRRAFAAHRRACAACREDLVAYAALASLARAAFAGDPEALDESLVARITSGCRTGPLPRG